MPITINGVPLVSDGAVNRQVIGTVARSGAQTFFELHPKALEAAHAHDGATHGMPPDPEAVKAVRCGLRCAGFVA